MFETIVKTTNKCLLFTNLHTNSNLILQKIIGALKSIYVKSEAKNNYICRRNQLNRYETPSYFCHHLVEHPVLRCPALVFHPERIPSTLCRQRHKGGFCRDTATGVAVYQLLSPLSETLQATCFLGLLVSGIWHIPDCRSVGYGYRLSSYFQKQCNVH